MIVLALIAFLLSTVGLACLEHRLHHRVHVGFQQWWIEQALLPLGRVFSLMLLITLSSPSLFGRQEPSLTQLLATPGRFDALLNLLFIAGVLLPLLPALRYWTGAILPLQGMAGVALIYHWLCVALGVDTHWWPAAGEAMLLLTLAVLAWAVARLLSRPVEDELWRQDIRDLLLLCLQAPVILLYGHMLGNRLLVAGTH